MYRNSALAALVLCSLLQASPSPLAGAWEHTYPPSTTYPFNAYLKEILVIGESDWTAATMVGAHNMSDRYTYRIVDSKKVELTSATGKTETGIYEIAQDELKICSSSAGSCIEYQRLEKAPVLKTGKHATPRVTAKITTKFDGQLWTQEFTAHDMEQVFPDDYQSAGPGSRQVDVGATEVGVYSGAVGAYLFKDDPSQPESYGAMIRLTYGLKDKSHSEVVAVSKEVFYLKTGVVHVLEAEHDGHKLSFTLELTPAL